MYRLPSVNWSRGVPRPSFFFPLCLMSRNALPLPRNRIIHVTVENFAKTLSPRSQQTTFAQCVPRISTIFSRWLSIGPRNVAPRFNGDFMNSIPKHIHILDNKTSVRNLKVSIEVESTLKRNLWIIKIYFPLKYCRVFWVFVLEILVFGPTKLYLPADHSTIKWPMKQYSTVITNNYACE